MKRIRMLFLDCIQKIVDKAKPVVVPCMHLCDATMYVVDQIMCGLNHNQYYVCMRDRMIGWCPDLLLSFMESMVFFLRLCFAAVYLTLTRIFEHRVLPASGKEFVGQSQECFNKMTNANITRLTPLKLFDTEDIQTMEQAEKIAQNLQKKCNMAQAVGSTFGIFGGITTIVGFALIPVTGGENILLSTGISLGLSGAVASIGATAVNVICKKKVRRNVDPILLKYLKLLKAMGQMVRKYVQLTESLAKLDSVQWYEHSEGMGERLQRLTNLRHTLLVVEVSFQALPEKVEELLQCMEILSNLVKEVTDEMHNQPDHRNVTVADDVDLTVKKAVEKILEYHQEKPTLISDFILGYFGYTEDDEISVDPEQLGNGNIVQEAPAVLKFAKAKYVIFETMDIALELADDVFLTAAESLKVISKVGIAISAIGMVIDIGILTKTLINLSNGSPETLSVHFRSWRLHMELINVQTRRNEIQFFGIFIQLLFVLVITLLIYIVLIHLSLV